MRDREDNALAGPEAGNRPCVAGYAETPAGRVARVATRLTWRDRLGAFCGEDQACCCGEQTEPVN